MGSFYIHINLDILLYVMREVPHAMQIKHGTDKRFFGQLMNILNEIQLESIQYAINF